MTAAPPPPRCWTAILLAGQRPGIDPLASSFGETYKARVAIAGEAMLGRVARTLLACPAIATIVVLAQEPEALIAGDLGWIADEPRIRLVAGSGGIAASVSQVVAGADLWPVLVTTADHPLLTPAIVAEFIAGAGTSDVAVGAVERSVVLAAYPDTRRTWLSFRGGTYSGANLFALGDARAMAALDLWTRAERDRKHVFKLFLHFGLPLAIRAITRTISLDDALRRAGRKLGFDARLVPLGAADAAVDVDKPADHALVERILLAREDQGSRAT